MNPRARLTPIVRWLTIALSMVPTASGAGFLDIDNALRHAVDSVVIQHEAVHQATEASTATVKAAQEAVVSTAQAVSEAQNGPQILRRMVEADIAQIRHDETVYRRKATKFCRYDMTVRWTVFGASLAA